MRTAAQWQDQAIRLAGCVRQNAIYEIAFAFATTGGTWVFGWNGDETDDLAYNINKDDLLAALEELPSIGSGNVRVEGIPKGPYLVEFTRSLGGMSVPDPTVDGSELDPVQTVEVNIRQYGSSDDYSNDAIEYWDDLEGEATPYLRMLRVADRLVSLRISKLSDRVDTRTGQVDITDIKGNQLFTNAIACRDNIQRMIGDAVTTGGVASRKRTHGGVMSRTTPNGEEMYALRRNVRTGRWG